MYLARRRAGSVIADPAKVVRTLQAAVVQGLVYRHRTGQPGGVGRNIVDHPVDPGFADGVRVVYYRARDGVPAGTVFHESARELSYPLQVCSIGRVVPALKASDSKSTIYRSLLFKM